MGGHAMNRIESPWPVRQEHGRPRWITPITLPVVDAQDFLDRHERGKRWKKRVATAAWVAFAGLLIATVLGCAHRPTTEPLVLPERAGSLAATAIEKATGQRPKAVALPGYRVVVFSPKDANDAPLLAHERCHQEQQARMGDVEWTAAYLQQLAECKGNQTQCLREIPLERDCYNVQHGWDEAKGVRR
jgi:hypothetical protein